MPVNTLIDKAAEKVGNKNKLATLLQCSRSQIYEWHSGVKKCSPADRARLAAIVGEDPVQELVRATLEETAGTPRGEQLKAVLGKWWHQTGAVLNGVVLALVSVTSSLMLFDVPRCIFWVFS